MRAHLAKIRLRVRSRDRERARHAKMKESESQFPIGVRWRCDLPPARAAPSHLSRKKPRKSSLYILYEFTKVETANAIPVSASILGGGSSAFGIRDFRSPAPRRPGQYRQSLGESRISYMVNTINF